ncbi:hypothetical protein, partial [Streptomyces hygroscopicus]
MDLTAAGGEGMVVNPLQG